MVASVLWFGGYICPTAISHDARKEVLKRLLKLNQEIHEQEVKANLHAKEKTKKETKSRCIKTNGVVLKKRINYKKSTFTRQKTNI